MIRQYIGARYVPKFYDNPNGTSEWLPNVIYEPLTIVTYDSNSYTSKKTVPASVGIPANNPEYWVATGNYNAFIQEVQDQLDTINGGLGNIINDDIVYDEDTTLHGFNYSLNGSSISSNHALTVDDIDHITITGSTTELLHCSDSTKINNSIIDNAGAIGVHHNSAGNNILISENEIESLSYAALINESANGSGAIISDNFIQANEGDAVELNNPNGSFSNNIVSNNILKAGSDGGSGHANGFSVGAAHVINAVINSNVSDYSRNEAVHVEAEPNKLIVSDNVFDNCQYGGIICAQGYGKYSQNGKVIIHSDNYYSAGSGNEQNGYYNVYSASEEDYIVIDNNNYYENFNNGIFNVGSTTIPHMRVFNDYIRNCNVGIKTNLNVYGKVIIDNCDDCVVITGNGQNVILEDLMIINSPAYNHIIAFDGTNSAAIIKKIVIAKHLSSESSIDVLPLAAHAKGILTLTANFGTTRAVRTYDVDGTTLTSLISDTYGANYLSAAFNATALNVTINNAANGELTVNFDGYYLIKQ